MERLNSCDKYITLFKMHLRVENGDRKITIKCAH